MQGNDEGWAEASLKANHGLFSELDVLLKALDRFLASEALRLKTSDEKDYPGPGNFRREIAVARDAIVRIFSILELVIPEEKRNTYWFRKYAEARLLTERERRLLQESNQTLEKSLYLLYDAISNLKAVVTDLLRNPVITYTGFLNISDMIISRIRGNAHFDSSADSINPEFDVVENRLIAETVKAIRDKEERKIVSVIFLELFRMLRYLRHADVSSSRSVAVHTALLILLLLRSRLEALRAYLDDISKTDKPVAKTAESLSYQFAMESKRIYNQELKDILRKTSLKYLKGRLENSHGILRNLLEQAVIQMVQHWRPSVRGEEIFPSFVTKLEQSLKLRQDIYVLERLLTMLESPEGRTRALRALSGYMDYFETSTFKLLRHDDYEEFAKFFEWFARRGVKFDEDAIEVCRRFRIYLEATLGHINNRAELAGRPIDKAKAEDLIRQYIS